MTHSRNIELTPEEQAELSKTMPDIVERIERRDRQAIAALNGLRYRMSLLTQAREQAEEIKREVAAAIEASGPEQGHLAHWCGFPTDMTRCSPFFPMRNNELGERRYIEDFLITAANWGEIKFSGPQLSTYDEDVLMVLLALLQTQSSYRKLSEVVEGEDELTGRIESFVADAGTFSEYFGARRTYTYRGPLFPFFKMMGIDNPGKTNYKRVLSSLKRMMSSVIEISISTGKTKSGKKRSPRIIQIVNMICGARWDDKKKELIATINPFFYETYLADQVTLIEVTKRMNIKGVIAKALYRFVQSHRQNPVFEGHFLTLADALNMDREQPAYQLRRQLKAAINELIRQCVLMKKSGFIDTDIIRLERVSNALPSYEEKKSAKR